MNRPASVIGLLLLLAAGAGISYLVLVRQLPAATGQFSVAATIFPLADIARQVGGDRVDVILLVPPGANEHSYSLTTQQVVRVSQAKTIFAVGHGLDDHIVAPITRAHGIAAVTADRGITLRQYESLEHEEEAGHEETEDEHRDEGTDPHYWLMVPNAAAIAETVAAKLIELDPANRAAYEANLADYLAELQALEQELQTIAQAAPQKNFIAMHNAWSYLAGHYGFELVAAYEPVEGSQPSLQDLQELQATIDRYGITTFYAEPQKVSAAATRFLAKEFNLKIAILDPSGGIGERDSYASLMRFNLSALAQ